MRPLTRELSYTALTWVWWGFNSSPDFCTGSYPVLKSHTSPVGEQQLKWTKRVKLNVLHTNTAPHKILYTLYKCLSWMWVGLEHVPQTAQSHKLCTLQTGNSKGGKHIVLVLISSGWKPHLELWWCYLPSVSDCWTGIWTEMVEWTMECLCIAIFKLISSVSTLPDPKKAGTVCMECIRWGCMNIEWYSAVQGRVGY